MFYSYFEHIADLEGRQIIIISKIYDFFAPVPGDQYYIMDPHLDPVNSLQEPFRERKLENKNWSFLLAELAAPESEFYIFTAQDVKGLTGIGKKPPYEIINDGQLSGAKANVCYYPRGRYNDFDIHDRYILQENKSGVKGLHIGPSLDDIYNKDVSLTTFTPTGAESALKSFKSLWSECLKTKAWKKG